MVRVSPVDDGEFREGRMTASSRLIRPRHVDNGSAAAGGLIDCYWQWRIVGHIVECVTKQVMIAAKYNYYILMGPNLMCVIISAQTNSISSRQ